jgi:LuxR family glucitol operon transcriptional activator
MLSLIPDAIKQALVDGLVNFLADQADRVADGTLGERLRALSSDGTLRRAMGQALRRALARFEREYGARDAALVAAISAQPGFWEQPALRKAIIELVARPGAWGEEQREVVLTHFVAALPEQHERERVEQALSFLLRCVAEEVWAIPEARELRAVYALQLQRHSAEALQRQVELAEQRLSEGEHHTSELRSAVLALLEAQRTQALLPPPASQQQARPRPWHNLPAPEARSFHGRQVELARLRELLASQSPATQVLILGIGGAGKSTLARSIAYEYVARYAILPAEERFEAIVWVSAKEQVLTPFGSAPAAPAGLIFRTLDDIYAAIAQVLERADLVQGPPATRDRLAQQVLAAQRTLLVVDNLESVSDAAVRAFLRQVPAPSRVLITSREWVDGAATLRLAGLPHAESLALLRDEAQQLGISLSTPEAEAIAQACRGLPLPLRLVVGRLESGERPAAVLRWLHSATGDLPAYCVASQAELARTRDPRCWALLLACALCDRESGGSRALLAATARLDAAGCDAAAGLLQRLSLLTPLPDERLTLLPLVERYVRSAATADELRDVGERWLAWLVAFARTVAARLDLRIELAPLVAREYPNLRAAIAWCQTQQRHGTLLELVRQVWVYAELTGRFDELEAMTDAALRAAELLGDVGGQAFCLRHLAWIGRIRGQALRPTLARLEQAEHLAVQAGDKALLADIWYATSDLREQQGELDAAEALAQRMRAMAEHSSDDRVRTLAAYRLAKFALRRGDAAAAFAWLEQADAAATRLGWRRQLAWNSYRRGVTQLAERDFAGAERVLEACLAEARAWDERRLQAYALQRLVEVYAATGRRVLASQVAEDLRERFARQGIDRHEFTQLLTRLRSEDALLAELLERGGD